MALATVASAAAVVVAVGWQRDSGLDRSLADVRQRGDLRIGYATEAPYAWLRADGTPDGESIAVAREVARQLQLRPTWTMTDFDRLIPELVAGRFDVIAAGLFITAERQRRVRFVRPELRVRPGWLSRLANPLPPASYAQASPASGLRVAVVSGSVEHAAFRQRPWPPAQLVVVPDAHSGAAAVLTGEADALALSLPTVSAMARADPAALQASPAGDAGVAQVALAVRADAAALAGAIDAVLADYVGSAAHQAMLKQHGLGADDLPEPPRARAH